jgi:hypothetical protein
MFFFYRFPNLPQLSFNAVTKNILMQRSDEAMIYIGSFKKYCYISNISVATQKNIVVFAITYVVWSVDSDEAVRRIIASIFKSV